MSLANDLLKTLSVEEEDKTLVINHYTRSIIIPKSITTLGVENDDDVLRLEFRMPRYLGTVDLSKFSIRVNYINAEGEDGFYKVTDSRVVGDNVLFSWLVGPTATAYKGTTSFNVNMVTTDSQSNVLNEYNTAIAKLPVLEGMTVSTDVITRYIDILEQWESRLFGISDTEEAKLIAVSEEEQKNISQHAGVVMASIPADYTTTSKLADKAERTKADAIICSAEGESAVKMEDSSDDKLRGLKIFGKTTQITTTGKNLVNLPRVVNKPASGYNYDLFTGTSGQSVPVDAEYRDKLPYLAAGTYYLNAEFEPGTANTEIKVMAVADDGSTSTASILVTHSGVFNVETDSRVTIRVGTGDATIISNIQIEVGNRYTGYEPYSGGFTSPSPNWSQELTSLENPTVTVCGKNLWDHSNDTRDMADIEGWANPIWTNDAVVATLVPKTTYTLSFDVTCLSIPEHESIFSADCGFVLYSSKTGAVTIVMARDNTSAFKVGEKRTVVGTFTTPGNVSDPYMNYEILRYTQRFLKSDGNGVFARVKFENVQLEENNSATEYEPYNGQTLTLADRIIPAVPVTSGGNYTDSTGQQWICDEIDFERGVYIQRIGSRTFTGTESWGEGTSVLNGMHRYYTWLYDMRPDDSGFGLCNYYPRTPLATEQIDYECVRFGQSNVAIFFFSPTIANVNDWTTHVASLYDAGKPIEVQYVLTTPIETPLTASDLEAFKALHSNYPTTTVLNDSGANMLVTYNADTKTWIENLIESKFAAYLEGADS